MAKLTPKSNAANNLIKIRLTSARELPFGAYLDAFRRQFAAQVGPVQKRAERHSGREMGVLSFTQSVPAGRVTSTSYFFAGGGKTWQLECLASGQFKAQLDTACRQAVDSISFS